MFSLRYLRSPRLFPIVTGRLRYSARNAIIGSMYLALGGTTFSFLIGLPVALYLNAYAGRSKFADWVRLALDFMWGIPSLIYGVFAFLIMMAVGLKASLLIGMIALSFVELPILTRGIRLTPAWNACRPCQTR